MGRTTRARLPRCSTGTARYPRRVRIAVAFDCFYPMTTGGGERQYRLFAEAWAGAGHEVDYLTRRLWDGAAPQVAPGVSVVGVSARSELYDARGNRRPLVALRFAAGLFGHLLRTRGRYDVVVVSALPVLNVFAARLALLGSRTRMCSDFLEVWRRDQWLEYSGPVVGRVAATLQHLAVRASPWVSCYSRMNARRLVAEGARHEPVLGPGLVGTEGSGFDESGFDDSLPATVVYVGRHIPDKQVDVIPAAIAWARRSGADLRAAVLGDGPQRAAVEREIGRLGLDDVVELPGFVPEDELHRRVASAAVLVNPSRREGYGLVVVEACASGTPVVLVDAEDNASVDLVDEGVNGFVAASTEPEVLGAALLRAIDAGPALRRSARAWYEAAARERTAAASALAIVERLTRA